jgi:cAMP-dependent protein kinase regulator
MQPREKDSPVKRDVLANKPMQKHISQHDDPSSDDEQDEDDEVEIDLPQVQAQQGKKQRTSVSAEAYGKFNKKSDFKPRVIPKNEDSKKRIIERLSKAFMFAALESREKDIVVDAMEEKKVPKGHWVINQGDDGDNLYVIDQGSLECFKRFSKNEEPKLVKTYVPGESFGELALLYNAPRAASIKAVTDCTLFALDRETFNNIVKDAEVKRRERFEQIMSKVEILETMDPYERSKIADVAVPAKYKKGEYVIRQGDTDDKFYFIEEGYAVATKKLAGKDQAETVYEYKPGEYFGELALLKNEPRAANVIATSDLGLLALDREAFTRVLGPLNDILKRNTKKYEKYM